MAILRVVEGGVQFAVRAQPKASRNRVAGLVGDRVKVAVTARVTWAGIILAVEQVVAEAFGVRESAVAVVGGLTSRDKVVRIRDLSAEEAERRWNRIAKGLKRS